MEYNQVTTTMYGRTIISFSWWDDLNLWHQRLGHMNTMHMTELINKEIVSVVSQLTEETRWCVVHATKENKTNYITMQFKMSSPNTCLIWYTWIWWGICKLRSLPWTSMYFLIDNFSRFTWVRFIPEKYDTLKKFKIWMLQLKNGKRT